MSRTPLLALIALTPLIAPVEAAGNRLLPFWGQPYPSGYAYTDRDLLLPARKPACRRYRQGTARPGTAGCEVVLHARG